MDELLRATAAWLPLTLLPVLLLGLAPMLSARGRTVAGAMLLLEALAAVAAAVLAPAETRRLEVVNPFFDPERGEPVRFVVDVVEAPAWQAPLVAAALLAVPALLLLLRRRRPARPPCPVTHAVLVTSWTLLARLLLEKSAAPEALTWATGVTVPTLVLLAVFAYQARARRASFGRWVGMLALLALVQRSLVVAWSYVATTRGLGTHLDLRAIHKVALLAGERDFSGPGDHAIDQWLSLVVVPQYVLWVPITVVAGVLLGAIPFFAGRPRG